MTLGKKETGKFILILKPTQDKRIRYLMTKKLSELWPETPFAQWKAKVDVGETIILMRAESPVSFDRFKKELDEIEAPVEIVEQKSIGGASVF